MPIIRICDADCKTVLKEGDEHKLNWGHERFYGPEALTDVEAYEAELMEATEKCQTVFKLAVEKARVKFHKKYPDGKLPDEKDEEVADAEV